MKSWERDLETHLTVLHRFVDLVDLPAGEADLLKRELERFIRVRLARGQWMEPDITGFHSEWYREFYRILGVRDPYRELKERSTRLARDLLERLHLPTLRDAVRASLIANLLDYGAPDLPERLSADDFAELDRLTLWADDFDRLEAALRSAHRVLYLADNSGEILFDAVVLERLHQLNPRCRVHVAGKAEPMLNDVTADELAAVPLPPNAQVVSTGSNAFGAPPGEVSEEFTRVLREADAIVAKGHAHLEFWLHYDLPNLFNVACTKLPISDPVLGDIPPGVRVILWSGRYGAGKRGYGGARGGAPLTRPGPAV